MNSNSNMAGKVNLLGLRHRLTPTAQLERAAQALNEAAVYCGLNSGTYKRAKRDYEELLKRLNLD